jgi:hypothetical protein
VGSVTVSADSRFDQTQAELTDLRLAAIVDVSRRHFCVKTLITTWHGGAEPLFGYAASDIIGGSITTPNSPDLSSRGSSNS